VVAQIEITDETERAGGWSFDAQVLDADGRLHHCTLHLSWADYNLWSPDGADAPARVAEAALAFFLSERSMNELKSSFDASLLRRIDPEADKKVPAWIGR
jgi:hypothetical protein